METIQAVLDQVCFICKNITFELPVNARKRSNSANRMGSCLGSPSACPTCKVKVLSEDSSRRVPQGLEAPTMMAHGAMILFCLYQLSANTCSYKNAPLARLKLAECPDALGLSHLAMDGNGIKA